MHMASLGMPEVLGGLSAVDAPQRVHKDDFTSTVPISLQSVPQLVVVIVDPTIVK